jgi:crooked neck
LAKSFLLFLIYYTIAFEFHHHLYFSFVFHESGVFEKTINYFRTSAPELKEGRSKLLEEWLNTESSFGKLGDVSLVQRKLPKKMNFSWNTA